MRVVILHRYPAAEVVGTNASFVSFLELLRKNNNDVHYLTYRDPEKAIRISGIKYEELPFSFKRGDKKDKLLKTFLWLILAPIKAWQINYREKIDLFYCDDSVPYYGFITKLLVGKTKVVIRMGDLQSGYQFANQGKIKELFFTIALISERFMWRRVDGIVAISKPFAKFIEEQGINKNKIKLVEESIDLEKFSRTEIKNNYFGLNNHPLIMFHGALIPCKGLETFIKAIPVVLKEVPKAVFIIAGGGPEEEKLKSISKDLVKENKLIFTGWYKHSYFPSIINNIDIGIVMRSSNMANNFVVTTCLLEYWASSKPVIVPDLEAMKNVVKDRVNGLFFKPDDEKDLAKQIIFLAGKKNIWKTLGKNGYSTAEKYFNKNLIAGKMVSVMEEFLI